MSLRKSFIYGIPIYLLILMGFTTSVFAQLVQECGTLGSIEQNRCGGAGLTCPATEECVPSSFSSTGYACAITTRCSGSSVSYVSNGGYCRPNIDTCCKGAVSSTGCGVSGFGLCYTNVCVACLPPGTIPQTASSCCSGSTTVDIYGTARCNATGCVPTGSRDYCGNSDVGQTKQCCDSTTRECKLNSYSGMMTCEPITPPSSCRTSGASCNSSNRCCSGYICSSSNVCVIDTTVPPPVGRYTGPLTSFTELLQSAYTLLYPIGLGIGAFFILLSGYCFMTSEGEPQAIKGCQEQFTGAIAGTLFILLSITLLRVIIGSILGVPGGF